MASDGMHFNSTYDEPLLSSYETLKDSSPPVSATYAQSSNPFGMSLSTLVTQLNSFLAVLWPVLVTMVIASLVAVFVQDAEAERAMSRYLYYKDIDASEESMGTKTIQALANALVIICFIAVVTFLVVLLYKINCMGGLQGYLMVSSATLLGLVGSVLAEKIFCTILEWPIDVYSMAFVMYNFAIVGTLSIFYQKVVLSLDSRVFYRGMSPDVGRAYLVVTSVIMSWQLCQLPSWSTWAILFALAFWDLFAVLTPCGPLRCLVNLIQSEGRPMPGLLYEADIQETHKSRSLPPKVVSPGTAAIYRALPAYAAGESARHLAVFESQLTEFCMDYRSPHMANVRNVARHYAHNQNECWRQLYTKYNVTYIRSNRSYPSVADVFDGTPPPSHESQPPTKETIKLGLGDFIFYSVLVARAAMTSFGAFAACFLCVVVGLAATMYLLGHFNALPALPISILLGISAFFWMAEAGNAYIEFLVLRGIC
ncbi:Aste57867_22362 [Aphanomyces stellatus]|uniref:Aste57867_22362 protein n=1 Tax=Aphanomyces stellatus TaxID=120398 RepID=A0A485LKR2_9STRA|nr:hypothetical protein As57867_022292 [Aphanomyces stellatus]VFT99025.1 Aste57867_22362 [Aphanomyces stellatus]